MDNLLNMGKQAFSAYEASQNQGQQHNNNQQVQGGAQYNSSNNGQPGQGIDLQAATQHAANDSNNQDSSLFTSALGFLQSKQDNNDTDVDEDEVQNAHKQACASLSPYQA